MSPIELFLALIALAFVGGLRAARGETRWGALPSGVEYVLLGVAIGPHLLGLVGKAAVSGFEPLLLMALGWLAAVRGANYSMPPDGSLTVRERLYSIAGSLACCLVVFLAAKSAAQHLRIGHPEFIALALTAVLAETSPFLLPADSGPHGPRLHSLRGSSSTTELPPLLALVAMMPFSSLGYAPGLPGYVSLLITVCIGVLLGVIVVALIGTHLEHAELWPLLLGSSLLVVGTTLRLQLPTLTPSFLLGLTVALLSRHRKAIQHLMGTTDRQLLLPSLLLAGVLLDFPRKSSEWWIIGAAVGARFLFKLSLGVFLSVRAGGSFLEGTRVGQALLRTSGLSVVVGLSIFLRYSGSPYSAESARIVLTAAIVSAALGETLGSFATRALLSGDVAGAPLTARSSQ